MTVPIPTADNEVAACGQSWTGGTLTTCAIDAVTGGAGKATATADNMPTEIITARGLCPYRDDAEAQDEENGRYPQFLFHIHSNLLLQCHEDIDLLLFIGYIFQSFAKDGARNGCCLHGITHRFTACQ